MINPFRWLDNAFPTKLKMGGYEGASTTRRLSSWGITSYGPNSVIEGSITSLRSRSRDLARNNSEGASGVGVMTANMVGRGITPKWNTGNKNLDKQIKALWDDSVSEIDYDERCDFSGLQMIATDAVQISGEVLVQFYYPRRNFGYTVPFQVKIIEADHLYDGFNHTLENGRSVRMGIEFTKAGKRAAYHVYREHPGDSLVWGGGSSLNTIRIPASDMLHIFLPKRPGQIRGVPWLASVITRLRQLDEYEDAELARKKVAAFFGAFITSKSGEPDATMLGGDETTETDSTGATQTVQSMEPGLIQYLDEDEDVKFAEPADVGGNYEVWIKRQLHAIAAAWGITYEQLTGDLKGVTYSSIRAGLLEFRRRCQMLQNVLLINQFCKPIVNRWLDMAVLSGALKIDLEDYVLNKKKYQKTIWYPDGWDWVDPEKEAKGRHLEMRDGTKSRRQVVAEQDRDVEELDAEIAEDNKRADELGLIFDSDPRRVSASGVKHKTEGSGSSPGNPVNDSGGGMEDE